MECRKGFSTVCNDFRHLFSCPQSGYYVRKFSYEPADNWYQTKTEFSTNAQALFLSDQQKVYCFFYCLAGLAETIYIETLKQLPERSFENLIAALDKRFNFYHPLRTIEVLKMSMKDTESVGEFCLRVEFAARDLYQLSSVVQDQYILDTILSGIPVPMREFVLDRAMLQDVLLDYRSLIQFCKTYEEIQFFTKQYQSDCITTKNERCLKCSKVVLFAYLSQPEIQGFPINPANEQMIFFEESEVLPHYPISLKEKINTPLTEQLLCEELVEVGTINCISPSQAKASICQALPKECCEVLTIPTIFEGYAEGDVINSQSVVTQAKGYECIQVSSKQSIQHKSYDDVYLESFNFIYDIALITLTYLLAISISSSLIDQALIRDYSIDQMNRSPLEDKHERFLHFIDKSHKSKDYDDEGYCSE